MALLGTAHHHVGVGDPLPGLAGIRAGLVGPSEAVLGTFRRENELAGDVEFDGVGGREAGHVGDQSFFPAAAFFLVSRGGSARQRSRVSWMKAPSRRVSMIGADSFAGLCCASPSRSERGKPCSGHADLRTSWAGHAGGI